MDDISDRGNHLEDAEYRQACQIKNDVLDLILRYLTFGGFGKITQA